MPVLLLFLLLMVGNLSLHAQDIDLKTLPVPTGEQFLLLPSSYLGAGGLSIATADTLLEPFTNPALGARMRGLRLSLTPTTYTDTNETMGGQSLPASLTMAIHRFFGTAAYAVQRVHDAPRQFFATPPQLDQLANGRDADSSSTYMSASFGVRLGARTAVGVGGARAQLGVLNGVRRRYGQSLAVDQEGERSELRFGLLYDIDEDRALDLVVARARHDMQHTVLSWDWEQSPEGNTPYTWTTTYRDDAETWSGRVRYRHALPAAALRLGATLAAEVRTQAEMPNYQLVNIPFDPGNTTMFEIGAGLEASGTLARWGVELAVLPGSSHTWWVVDSAFAAPFGSMAMGERAVDNQFSFLNWRLATGVAFDTHHFAVQLGMRVHQYRYRLTQTDYLRVRERTLRESWLEFSPSAGMLVRVATVELGYTGRLIAHGTSPCPPWSFRPMCVLGREDYDDTGLVVPATQPDNLPDFLTATHRVTFTVPLRW